MSKILSTLKLTAATKPAQATNPAERGREKLRAYLSEQRALAQARIDGKPFAAVRTVTKKDEAGNRVRSEVPRVVRQGWFAGDGGKVLFQLRYGARPLDLGKGVNAVEVENLQALPTVIDTLSQAVDAGEFDPAVTAAAQERGKALKQAKAKA